MNKKKMVLAWIILGLFYAVSAGADEILLWNETYYVDSYSGLILRTEPSRNSTKIITISNNVQVTAVARTNRLDHIDNHEAYWYKVRALNQTGWVYGGYLSKTNAVKKIIGNWWCHVDTETYTETYLNQIFLEDGRCLLGLWGSEGALGTWHIKDNLLYIDYIHFELGNGEPDTETPGSSDIIRFEFIGWDTLRFVYIPNGEEAIYHRKDEDYTPQ
jgi:hypothetical protein